jgi:hypothetical protein
LYWLLDGLHQHQVSDVTATNVVQQPLHHGGSVDVNAGHHRVLATRPPSTRLTQQVLKIGVNDEQVSYRPQVLAAAWFAKASKRLTSLSAMRQTGHGDESAGRFTFRVPVSAFGAGRTISMGAGRVLRESLVKATT